MIGSLIRLNVSLAADAIQDDVAEGMTRVTGKFQITLPKRLVDAYGIRVGDEVELVASRDVIAIMPAGAGKPRLSLEERLRLFDEATRRQSARESLPASTPSEDRGRTRDELYDRGRPR